MVSILLSLWLRRFDKEIEDLVLQVAKLIRIWRINFVKMLLHQLPFFSFLLIFILAKKWQMPLLFLVIEIVFYKLTFLLLHASSYAHISLQKFKHPLSLFILFLLFERKF